MENWKDQPRWKIVEAHSKSELEKALNSLDEQEYCVHEVADHSQVLPTGERVFFVIVVSHLADEEADLEEPFGNPYM